MDGPHIEVANLDTSDKKVVIAVPIDELAFNGERLVVAFIEIDMDVMLKGVSMVTQDSGATFCNLYTHDGVALSNAVLGGLAEEDNLLEAMKRAEFEQGYSLEGFLSDFTEGRKGAVSYTYDGIQGTLSYVPVDGTDWQLTYLIRESVISDQIGSVSDGIIRRSLVQSVATALVLLALFAVIIQQMLRSAQLELERETADAENRTRREELEHRLALQEQLLEQEREQQQQNELITALAADYWSVYYLELDDNWGTCYQSHADIDDGFAVGDEFPYLESVTAYANRYVTDTYRQEFLDFIFQYTPPTSS
jgi:hypothetical protein